MDTQPPLPEKPQKPERASNASFRLPGLSAACAVTAVGAKILAGWMYTHGITGQDNFVFCNTVSYVAGLLPPAIALMTGHFMNQGFKPVTDDFKTDRRVMLGSALASMIVLASPPYLPLGQ